MTQSRIQCCNACGCSPYSDDLPQAASAAIVKENPGIWLIIVIIILVILIIIGIILFCCFWYRNKQMKVQEKIITVPNYEIPSPPPLVPMPVAEKESRRMVVSSNTAEISPEKMGSAHMYGEQDMTIASNTINSYGAKRGSIDILRMQGAGYS